MSIRRPARPRWSSCTSRSFESCSAKARSSRTAARTSFRSRRTPLMPNGSNGRSGPRTPTPGRPCRLWRGPALADVADEPFAAAEIRRLDELRIGALEAAIEGDLRQGRHAQALTELEPLLADNPCARASTLSACSRCTERPPGGCGRGLSVPPARSSSSELGLEPGPELRELHEAILRHDPALAASPRGAGAPAGHGLDAVHRHRGLDAPAPGGRAPVCRHAGRAQPPAAGRGRAPRRRRVRHRGRRALLRLHGRPRRGRRRPRRPGGARWRARVGPHGRSTPASRRSTTTTTWASTCIAPRGSARSAHGGQVVLSERTQALLGDAFECVPLGLHRLKDLREREKLFQLGTRASSLRCDRSTRRTCPAPPSRLVGRRAELGDDP